MYRKYICLILFTLFFYKYVSAEDIIDESELFADSETVVEIPQQSKIIPKQIVEENKYSFSGVVNNYNYYYLNNDFVKGKGKLNDNKFTTLVRSDLFLDIRFKRNIKVFINLDLSYSPQDDIARKSHYLDSSTTVGNLYNNYNIKEFFIDSNINNFIYLRIGKQVLQW